MSRRFSEIAFTPAVKREQEKHGSRRQYQSMEQLGDCAARLGEDEQVFLRGRDGFYMASVSETGWPYIQYRGGAKGFLRVLDNQTIGFADLRGNRQYISVGNLKQDGRVALFLMDYPTRSRLKILGRVQLYEDGPAAQEWIDKLRVPEEKSVSERAVVIHVEAFDWNCPQHITPRYTAEELTEILEPERRRLAALEEENARLREELQQAHS